jgi:hypothetical protein
MATRKSVKVEWNAGFNNGIAQMNSAGRDSAEKIARDAFATLFQRGELPAACILAYWSGYSSAIAENGKREILVSLTNGKCIKYVHTIP